MTTEDTQPWPKYSLRDWLVAKAVLAGAPWGAAIEAVSSTALDHPEIDYDEERTWEEWDSSKNGT